MSKDDVIYTEQKAFKELEKSIKKHGKLYAKLATYELNPSTGEVEKRFKDGTSKPNGEQFNDE